MQIHRNQLFTVFLACLSPLLVLGADLDPFSPGFGLGDDDHAAAGPHVQAKLVAEKTAIVPGETVSVALVLTHEERWHTYYTNPGSAGYPPSLEWDLPEGFKAGALEFPTPKTGSLDKMVFYGYDGETWFFTKVTAPAEAAPGLVTLKAHASWLTCDTLCITEEADLELKLEVGEKSEINAAASEQFTKNKWGLPADKTGWQVTANESGKTVTLTLTPPAGKTPDPGKIRFFSAVFEQQLEDPDAAQKVVQKADKWLVSFPLNPDADGPIKRAHGILKATNGWGENPEQLGWLIDVPIGGSFAAAEPSQAAGPATGLAAILGLMFLGGLILNLMPCVFPVIGLKIMGFVEQAGHAHSKIIGHGLVFTLGVLVSFWTLAGILLAGGIANWGNQLENPWVTFTLLLIMLVLGLNMFGVFEIGTSATGVGGKLISRSGLSGTFFSGVLATVLATPCSAPFLATGLAATVTLPAPQFFLSFTMMALGLSVPYLFFSLFPSLIAKLPRPGAWMESFKQAMSFLLFATAGYLLWVYSAQVFEQKAEQKGMWVMIGLAMVACALWVYGRWDLPHRVARTRWIARAFTLLLLAGGVFLSRPTPDPAQVADTAQVEWQAWSKDLQDRLIAEGKPVFVDFTARWCITCQTNKANAYNADMIRYFRDKGIVALKADKTKPNKQIDIEIRRLGRAGIPVNVFYAPGSSEPHITETLLTPGYLRHFFDSLLGAVPEAGLSASRR